MLKRLLVCIGLACCATTPVASAQEDLEPPLPEEPDPVVVEQAVERALARAMDRFEPDPTAAKTVSVPAIEPEALAFLLLPLSVHALENELEAWRLVVEDRVTTLSAVERALFEANKAEDSQAQDTAADRSGDTPAADELGHSKQQLLAEAAERRDARSEALDRLRVVLEEYETKGGDPEVVDKYAAYASAVGGVTVDVSDSETALQTLLSWARSAQGGQELLREAGLFALAVLGALLIGHLISAAVNTALKTTEAASVLLRRFLRVWIRRIAIVVGLVLGLTVFDVNITPLIAGIGAAGFILAFALQNTLSNFASGLLIMTQRPFDVGDSVEAAGIIGTIERVTLFSTYMSTEENKRVIVPNNMIWDGIIVNATGTPTRRLAIEFEVSAECGIKEAERQLMDIMVAHPEVMDDPPPEVKLTSIDKESMAFICWPWVPTAKKDRVRWELVEQVAQRLSIRRGATKAGV